MRNFALLNTWMTLVGVSSSFAFDIIIGRPETVLSTMLLRGLTTALRETYKAAGAAGDFVHSRRQAASGEAREASRTRWFVTHRFTTQMLRRSDFSKSTSAVSLYGPSSYPSPTQATSFGSFWSRLKKTPPFRNSSIRNLLPRFRRSLCSYRK